MMSQLAGPAIDLSIDMDDEPEHFCAVRMLEVSPDVEISIRGLRGCPAVMTILHALLAWTSADSMLWLIKGMCDARKSDRVWCCKHVLNVPHSPRLAAVQCQLLSGDFMVRPPS